MDYEVERCTRRCAASGRELAEGETVYSVLVRAGAELERRDYATEAWQGPPAESLGWWKSQIPTREAKRARLAPSEVLLQLFDELEAQPGRADLRYVLALLLVRRRVLRQEEPPPGAPADVLTLYSPREDKTWQVAVVPPGDTRAQEIQDELARLLYADVT